MTLPAVLIVHNRYRERGGEDSVFEAEADLLERRSHRVRRLVFDNRDLSSRAGPASNLRLAVETIWSQPARERIRAALQEFGPDVVHFHNTLPQVSPAAYTVCQDAGAAVVQTLHNYRLICPGATLYREGRVCEACLGKTLPWDAVRYGCYRGSRLQSGAVAAMLVAHRLRGTYRNDVDLYVAPSAFLRDKLVAGGLPPERVVVKPNFVDPDPGTKQPGGAYVLFVGRLTETKGVMTLLAAYEADASLPPLQIAGEGEFAGRVRAAAARDGRITYLGRLEREAVLATMQGARCLVFPSLWYENFPVTIVEAFACGLPVVASDIGAVPGIVEAGRTGLLFRAGDAFDLATKLSSLWQDDGAAEAMGAAARATYRDGYTGEANYRQLQTLYQQAMAVRRRSSLKRI